MLFESYCFLRAIAPVENETNGAVEAPEAQRAAYARNASEHIAAQGAPY